MFGTARNLNSEVSLGRPFGAPNLEECRDWLQIASSKSHWPCCLELSLGGRVWFIVNSRRGAATALDRDFTEFFLRLHVGA